MSTKQSLGEIVQQAIASGKATIPVFDRNAARAQQMLQRGEFDLRELEELVSRDPAITSGLLRAANSSFYGGLSKIVTVRDALARLGTTNIAQLIVLVTQKQHYRLRDPKLAHMAELLWRHAVACAAGSRWLAKRLHMPEVEAQAMLGGLLHDVGKLFLLRVVDELLATKCLTDPSAALLQELLTKLHGETGERLLASWNIPDPYRSLVRRHHDCEFREDELLLLVVRLADQACNKLGIGLEPAPNLSLAATAEAQALNVPELTLAELEIAIEDARELAD
jgi:HD-like signal output (HDOD) protein